MTNYQLSHIRTQSSKVPDKFWSFKDTKHYKKAKYKELCNIDDVYRRFIFTKSYLLEIYDIFEFASVYVIPLEFNSYNFPKGSYSGISSNRKIYGFTEQDIIKVLSEN